MTQQIREHTALAQWGNPKAARIPSNIHELFAGWEDGGVRPGEMDWGESEGNELAW